MKSIFRFFAIALLAVGAVACISNTKPSQTLESAIENGVNNPAKYVFFFIGDGMAAVQVRLAEAALTVPKFGENFAALTGAEQSPTELFLSSLEVTGLATTNAINRYITDSAAAGTALATGTKTDVGVIGLDNQGNRLTSIAEKAKANGMKVGIVSSASIDHATPASFYAHTQSRNNYATISDQLLDSEFDYFAGGSIKFDSRARREINDNKQACRNYLQSAEDQGYTFTTTRAEFDSIAPGANLRYIATLDMLANKQYSYDGYSMPYTIDLDEYGADDRISLADFTRKGIELLDNENGFFMMVEGGKIDWACHSNDAVSIAYELIAFDQAIGEAMEFAKKHPNETLIVVTGDHECGGLTLGFAGTGYESSFELLSNTKCSSTRFEYMARTMIKEGAGFDAMLKLARQYFGFTNLDINDDSPRINRTMELSKVEIEMLRQAYDKSVTKELSAEDIYLNKYAGNDPFTVTCLNILNNKAGVGFASFSHTAVPVMVYAGGVNAELFTGYYDNTDIAKRILLSLGIE